MTVKDELYQHIQELQDEIDYTSHEMQYLHNFLSWKNLWDDFAYFRMNAHLEQDEEDPFPRYVL